MKGTFSYSWITVRKKKLSEYEIMIKGKLSPILHNMQSQCVYRCWGVLHI